MHLEFNNEYDELLNLQGDAADGWLRRVRRYGKLITLIWVIVTHKPVPSDKGLLVMDRKYTFRLGDFAMLAVPEWRSFQVVLLQSSRQKAWLHGCTFPLDVSPFTQDENGREV